MPKQPLPPEAALSDVLPHALLTRIQAVRAARRWGSERCCDRCGLPIRCLDAELEVDARLGELPLKLHFHSGCFDQWKAEHARGLRPVRLDS